jgi:hypothetical protein
MLKNACIQAEGTLQRKPVKGKNSNRHVVLEPEIKKIQKEFQIRFKISYLQIQFDTSYPQIKFRDQRRANSFFKFNMRKNSNSVSRPRCMCTSTHKHTHTQTNTYNLPSKRHLRVIKHMHTHQYPYTHTQTHSFQPTIQEAPWLHIARPEFPAKSYHIFRHTYP